MIHIFSEIEREGFRQIKNIDVFSRNERKGKRKKEINWICKKKAPIIVRNISAIVKKKTFTTSRHTEKLLWPI